MISFLDRTFCASNKCTNKCGRKMTKEQKTLLKKLKKEGKDLPVCIGKFCEENQ